MGKDPVETLSERLYQLVQDMGSLGEQPELLQTIEDEIQGLQNGELQQCSTCGKTKTLEDFYDPSLRGGLGNHGRKCMECKGKRRINSQFEKKIGFHKKSQRDLVVGINKKGPFLRLGQSYLTLTSKEEALNMTYQDASKYLSVLLSTPPWTPRRRGHRH